MLFQLKIGTGAQTHKLMLDMQRLTSCKHPSAHFIHGHANVQDPSGFDAEDKEGEGEEEEEKEENIEVNKTP